MTNRRLQAAAAIILTSLLIISCKKDNGDPTIKFVPGPGFTGRDTMMLASDTLPVTVEVIWNGVDALDTLIITQNDVRAGTSAMNGEADRMTVDLVKGSDETEKWSFVIKDKKGNQASASLTLTKDPDSKYGGITFYSSVVIGAQNNTAKGGFIGFQTNPAMTYTLEGAFMNQDKIDLLYFSDPSNGSTLASPGSDIPDNLYPGSRSINLWSVKNFSHYLKTTFTEQEFNAIALDNVIVDTWSDSKSVSKAGDLKAGDIWLVKIQSGKKAAILVKRIVPGDNGEIGFAIKIQE